MRFFGAYAITLLLCINIIIAKLLRYSFQISHEWPSDLKFESHLVAKATLCNFIVVSPANKIFAVSKLFFRIICLAAIIKPVFLASVLLKNF